MTELDAYKQFFAAWEAQQAVQKKNTPEYAAAGENVRNAADVVRAWQKKPAEPEPDAAVQDYRALAFQVAAIPPKDTRGPKAKGPLNVSNG